MEYPVVPLREGVVFPHTEAHLTFGRPKSNTAIESAITRDRRLIFVSQKKPVDDPQVADLYEYGTLCEVIQIVPYGNEILALVRGLSRVKITEFTSVDPFFVASFEPILETFENNDKTIALGRKMLTQFKNAFNIGKSVEFPVFMRLMSGVSASELTDQMANALDLKTAQKQEILEILSIEARMEKVMEHLNHEMKILDLEKDITKKTNAKYEKNYRTNMLMDRKRAIQEELDKLGSPDDEDGTDDMSVLKKKIKDSHMPKEVFDKASKEVKRLSQMSMNNPESGYIRAYVEWLSDMPWDKKTNSTLSLDKAQEVLDEDHYGLTKAKERILEFLAVLKLKEKSVKKTNGSPTILCFAGAPGVGKTSIGKSIAKALNRKFVRMSLGGIRDEAEIRGHRRTYVGALPGRIIQGIKTAGSKNPVFMLDEIDKLASDYRGDPSSALLEALDPEQNKEFSDHYLEVAFDLSEVIFIATANMLDNIPSALRDRMEIIQFPGYTLEEKLNIGKRHLWNKQCEINGLNGHFKITDDAMNFVVKRYTREAGVRNLERNLAQICRKLAKALASDQKISRNVDQADARKLLGPEKFGETLAEDTDQVGISTGMAWTEAGGDILFIETALMPGKGELQLTGQLGDVMKESAKAAYSYIRSRWDTLGLSKDFYKKTDVHVHVPEGAVPKDGPSAGLAMATSMISALTHRPFKKDFAMTGEITLRGRAMEIGGVKEKVIAAHRAGIKDIILPKTNEKDLEDIPDSVKQSLRFHFVSHLDSVLPLALSK